MSWLNGQSSQIKDNPPNHVWSENVFRIWKLCNLFKSLLFSQLNGLLLSKWPECCNRNSLLLFLVQKRCKQKWSIMQARPYVNEGHKHTCVIAHIRGSERSHASPQSSYRFATCSLSKYCPQWRGLSWYVTKPFRANAKTAACHFRPPWRNSCFQQDHQVDEVSINSIKPLFDQNQC